MVTGMGCSRCMGFIFLLIARNHAERGYADWTLRVPLCRGFTLCPQKDAERPAYITTETVVKSQFTGVAHVACNSDSRCRAQ